MHVYTATIGRNYSSTHPLEGLRDEPMTISAWEAFIEDVTADMRNSAEPNNIEAVEIHRGKGVWQGIEEESAKITLLLKSALPEDGERSLNVLRGYLSENARHYGQDAIALTVGVSELC